jgi:glucan phosphoethanolaminetransferase (alkaline phosphatase superfamily)
MNTLKLIAKIFFLIFTILYLLVPFLIIIKTKIEKPNFKNLDNICTIFLGIILLIFIALNIKMFKPYFNKKY